MIDRQIGILKREIKEYTEHILKMFDKAFSGLESKDKLILETVITEMEDIANRKELEIENLCITTIAQFEPRAQNLRFVLMVLKINNDLERIADLIVNMCVCSKRLIKAGSPDILTKIQKISVTVRKMLLDTLSAFDSENSKYAREIFMRDDTVDNMRDDVYREEIARMNDSPEIIKSSLQVIKMSHNLERIADLTTNFCEDIIYYLDGDIIKHHTDEI